MALAGPLDLRGLRARLAPTAPMVPPAPLERTMELANHARWGERARTDVFCLISRRCVLMVRVWGRRGESARDGSEAESLLLYDGLRGFCLLISPGFLLLKFLVNHTHSKRKKVSCHCTFIE